VTGKPRPVVAYVTLVCIALFSAAYVAHVADSVDTITLSSGAAALLVTKTVVELVASAFGIAFLISALAFLFTRDPAGATAPDRTVRHPPIGIVYLCCDDADWSALASLASLSYPGRLRLVIHDDSRKAPSRFDVDQMAARLAEMREWDVQVLRRPMKTGGKAGAVNYVLERTGDLYEYFLLCDNDSTVLDRNTLQDALKHVAHDRTAVVQFRSVPVADPGYCAANSRLAESIGAFHAFLTPAAKYGWMPFIGHNALLRTSAVRTVGGLTPDFFSDDLDLTVRLNLSGFRVVYAPEITMGEKHPPSYTAFRKRSYKWAYGCVQTLRAHWWNVIASPRFSIAEKLSFFQFAGFYLLQCVLLAYLCFSLVAVPAGVLGEFSPDRTTSLLVGTVLVGLVYAPLLSFYLKTAANRRRGWVVTLALCGLVYGGTDFSVFRGVTDALRRCRRQWIPTNGVAATAVDPTLFVEALLGVVLLAVPLLYMPEQLYLPCWYLFAGKFMFGPALSLFYRDDPYDAWQVRDDRLDRPGRAVAFAVDQRAAFERAGS
jgi:1,2-diacylglycerol 3-beta-glucosyltransferase